MEWDGSSLRFSSFLLVRSSKPKFEPPKMVGEPWVEANRDNNLPFPFQTQFNGDEFPFDVSVK